MKRLINLISITISLSLFVGFFFGGTNIITHRSSKVAAEIPPGCAGSTSVGPVAREKLVNCPVCYQREPENRVEINPPIVTRVLNCAGEPNFIAILQSVRGHGMDGRTCYIIQQNVSGITNGDAFGSDICNAAEAARIDKGTPAPGGGDPSSPPPAGSPAPGGGTPASGGSSAGSGDNAGASNGPVAPEGPDKAKIDAAKSELCNDPDKKDSSGNKVCNVERYESVHCNGPQDCIAKNPLIKYLGLIFDVLSAVVTMAIIGAVIVGGIRYSASGGDPNGVAKAKKMIANALLALVGYIFLYAFLQWLVPGGLF